VEFKVLKNITRYLLFLENIGWAGNVWHILNLSQRNGNVNILVMLYCKGHL
jgi:hypothetical protein